MHDPIADSAWRRCFIALAPDDASRHTLGRMRPAPTAAVRPVHPADLHLTLAFLGAIDPAQGVGLLEALPALGGLRSSLAFERIDYWPRPDAPRVCVARFELAPELLALHERITELLRTWRLPIEGRAYRPHVTLARYRSRSPSTATAQAGHAMKAGPADWQAGFPRLGLYTSESGAAAGSPRYRALVIV